MAKSASKENQQINEEDEETAVEVEKVLLAKLQSGIDSNGPLSSHYKKCKELLEKMVEESPGKKAKISNRDSRIKFRRRVHLLNKLLAEYDSAFNKINFPFQHRLNLIMEDIRKDLDKDQQQQPKQELGKEQQQQPQEEGKKPLIEKQTERVPSRATPIQSYGFNIDLMAAENLLLCHDVSEEFNIAGIYGAEGVGKTTLAQVVFHCEKARSMFLPRIWICLPDKRDTDKRDTDKRDADKRDADKRDADKRDADELDADERDSPEAILTKRILIQLGFDDKEMDRSKIRSALLRKRYLIVLDGASEDVDYNKKMIQMLKGTLPKGTGGAVIVTGRVKDAVKAMVGDDADAVHRLLPLDTPVVCWDIYNTTLELGNDEAKEEKMDADERTKVRNEVVKRSDGLPWGARLLGILRREILEEKKRKTSSQATATSNNTATQQKA